VARRVPLQVGCRHQPGGCQEQETALHRVSGTTSSYTVQHKLLRACRVALAAAGWTSAGPACGGAIPRDSIDAIYTLIQFKG
jgi:hypothetical protein